MWCSYTNHPYLHHLLSQAAYLTASLSPEIPSWSFSELDKHFQVSRNLHNEYMASSLSVVLLIVSVYSSYVWDKSVWSLPLKEILFPTCVAGSFYFLSICFIRKLMTLGLISIPNILAVSKAGYLLFYPRVAREKELMPVFFIATSYLLQKNDHVLLSLLYGK